jgi:thiol-activated cytolysin
MEQVHSQEQLSLALGASASWLGSAASIAASFDWSSQEVRSRYLVRYTQAYYTVDIDQPGAPSDFFAPSVTLEQVSERMQPGDPPLYVSSITYGRMIVFTFESSYSAEELAAALSFVYEGGAEVSGDVSVTYQDIVASAKITAYILGGSGGDAAQAVDSYDALMDLIHSGGDYSRQSPGLPIAYKLAYLADNSPGRISLTEDYQVRDCLRVGQKIKVSLLAVEVEDDGGDAGDDLEIYGQVWAGSSQDAVLLLDKSSLDKIIIGSGQHWPQQAPAAEAVLEVSPQPGEEIDLGAELWDYDPTSADDWLGIESFTAAFETGWRRDVSVLLTGDAARVRVTFRLEPI